MRIRRTIAQAAAVAVIGTAAGLIFNAFSVNGIDPFNNHDDVPVFENGDSSAVSGAPEAREGVCLVSLEEFRGLVDGGHPVIDARTRAEYESGHIPGAMLLDYFEMGRYFDSVLPRLAYSDSIAVYCSGPNCDDSEMLAKELFAMGYRNLCVFRGGIEKWNEAGLELEYGPEEDW